MASPTHRPKGFTLADVMAEMKKLADEIELLKRMACPHCGPAVIAEMHPESVPPATVTEG